MDAQTYIIAAILAAWIGIGFAGNRYFAWRAWDDDRRIARARKVGYERAAALADPRFSKTSEQVRRWTHAEILAYERDHPGHSVKV